MARDNFCIYCGSSRDVSREHIMPATMGGRLERKGILCGTCNEGLSTLNERMGRDYAVMNGFLGVQGVRHDSPVRARGTLQSGESVEVDAFGQAHVSAKKSERQLADGQIEARIMAATDVEARRVIRQLEKRHGRKATVNSRDKTTRFITEPISMKVEIGSRELLRAMGAVTLHTLAHVERRSAAHGQLHDFKNYILGKRQTDEVGFLIFPSGFNIPVSYAQHVLVLSLSKAHQRVSGWLRMFGVYDFGIRLGSTIVDEDSCHVVTFSPVEHDPARNVTFVRRAPVPEQIAEDIRWARPDDTEARLSKFFVDVERRQIGHWEDELLSKLQHISVMDGASRSKELGRLMISQRQLIWGQVKLGASILHDAVAGLDGPYEDLIAVVDQMIETEAGAASGVSQLADCILKLTGMQIQSRLESQMLQGTVTGDVLQELFLGQDGTRIVLRVISDVLSRSDQRWEVLGTISWTVKNGG